MIEITRKNVEELWGLYEEYLKDFKERHYSNAKPEYFEEMVEHMIYCENTNEYHWKDDCEYCNNCQSWYLKDEMSTEELALQDGICEYCMEDGYGK